MISTESNRNTCCPLQLAASLQQTNMKLVGEAYSSIKVTQLAAMLGVEEEVKWNDYLYNGMQERQRQSDARNVFRRPGPWLSGRAGRASAARG